MASEGKRVAIVGAGVSGLVSIKCCLEDDLQPVCFEKSDKIAGLWNYSDEVRPDEGAAIYRSVTFNTSKEMTAFSDYPFPKDAAPFPTHKKGLAYLHAYAKHFDLEKHIQFNTKVMKIERNEGEEKYWKVVVQMDSATTVEENFDYVMVCSGMFGKKFMPNIPGLDTFKGMKVNCNEYRDAEPYKDKKVLVVGGGLTAGEIACEIARTNAEVYISMRNGTMCISRLCTDGLPWDMTVFTRHNMKMEASELFSLCEQKCMTRMVDHKTFGIHIPEKPLAQKSFMIADDFQDRIVQGQLTPVADVKEFGTSDVKLKDGTVLENIDAVIFATGYRNSIPFLDKSLLYDDCGNWKLYRYAFPVRAEHPERLAMIGMVSAQGCVWHFAELQARWACQIFNNKLQLPDRNAMEKDIQRWPIYTDVQYHFVPGYHMVDEIAEDIGVKPILSDPELVELYEYGPMVSYWHRLQGPGAWPGARDAILNAKENTTYATRRFYGDDDK